MELDTGLKGRAPIGQSALLTCASREPQHHASSRLSQTQDPFTRAIERALALHACRTPGFMGFSLIRPMSALECPDFIPRGPGPH